jgi:hypothetical protein
MHVIVLTVELPQLAIHLGADGFEGTPQVPPHAVRDDAATVLGDKD